MSDIPVSNVSIDSISPYPLNAKEHPDKQIEQIANSIQEFGFNQPVVVDDNGVIIVGHGRYLAAKKLGLVEVPCIVANLSEEQASAYRLADNKLNESKWNMKLVMEVLGTLEVRLQELTGFTLDLDDDKYTDKIEAPIYEIKNEKPSVDELYNSEKVNELLAEIEGSDISEEDKQFLRVTAQRHCIFDYGKLAEYYAHSDKNVQELMENSALVIIDFDKAIEHGYVKLVDVVKETYAKEYDEEQ